jgi:hypothetical protein
MTTSKKVFRERKKPAHETQALTLAVRLAAIKIAIAY